MEIDGGILVFQKKKELIGILLIEDYSCLFRSFFCRRFILVGMKVRPRF
jgi:hypothetical protein